MKNPFTSLLPGRAAEQKASATTKRINLALQGGGAHGAFTWGVLDQLLERRAACRRGHFRNVGGRASTP